MGQTPFPMAGQSNTAPQYQAPQAVAARSPEYFTSTPGVGCLKNGQTFGVASPSPVRYFAGEVAPQQHVAQLVRSQPIGRYRRVIPMLKPVLCFVAPPKALRRSDVASTFQGKPCHHESQQRRASGLGCTNSRNCAKLLAANTKTITPQKHRELERVRKREEK